LIYRKNYPQGWALPGGFVDYGETLEEAAIREAKEETNLDVELLYLLGCYSDPKRDPRFHTITTVFVARGSGEPRAQDDAKDLALFNIKDIPWKELVFDATCRWCREDEDPSFYLAGFQIQKLLPQEVQFIQSLIDEFGF